MKIEFGKKAQIIIALLLMIGAAGAIAEYGNNINIPGNFTGLNGIFSGDININDGSIILDTSTDGIYFYNPTDPDPTCSVKLDGTTTDTLLIMNTCSIIGGGNWPTHLGLIPKGTIAGSGTASEIKLFRTQDSTNKAEYLGLEATNTTYRIHSVRNLTSGALFPITFGMDTDDSITINTDGSTTQSSMASFTASGDQIDFPIVGQNHYRWMAKPSANIAFGVYNVTSPRFPFFVNQSGNLTIDPATRPSGISMYSPDGSAFCITVANGGTLDILAGNCI